jgi:tRNA G18 (ribose-2'-O)-methylase SpoU
LIILGNEELGIAPELMAEATMKVTIPMAGRKASMNVAGAFAIMAFKIRSAHS